MHNLIILTLSFILLTGASYAAEFTLPYQASNKWVSKQDNAPLRDLLAAAKKEQVHHFYVVLPTENRGLSIERLKVLRDILAQSLAKGVILEEQPGNTPANTLAISTSRASE